MNSDEGAVIGIASDRHAAGRRNDGQRQVHVLVWIVGICTDDGSRVHPGQDLLISGS